jgi:hypothetical protein
MQQQCLQTVYLFRVSAKHTRDQQSYCKFGNHSQILESKRAKLRQLCAEPHSERVSFSVQLEMAKGAAIEKSTVGSSENCGILRHKPDAPPVNLRI